MSSICRLSIRYPPEKDSISIGWYNTRHLAVALATATDLLSWCAERGRKEEPPSLTPRRCASGEGTAGIANACPSAGSPEFAATDPDVRDAGIQSTVAKTIRRLTDRYLLNDFQLFPNFSKKKKDKFSFDFGTLKNSRYIYI